MSLAPGRRLLEKNGRLAGSSMLRSPQTTMTAAAGGAAPAEEARQDG